jgi:Leucine-rich repeat (LRR) protein
VLAGVVALPSCQHSPGTGAASAPGGPSLALAFASNTQEGEVTVREGTEVEVRFNHPYQSPPQVVVVEMRGAKALESYYAKEEFQVVRSNSSSFVIRNNHSERGESWATVKWRAEGTLARGRPTVADGGGDQVAQKGKSDQELLIERIKAAGGKVSIDPNAPKPPGLNAPPPGREADKNAVNVTLTSAVDPRLAKNSILAIDVHGIAITDADVTQFEGITTLHTLNLYGTKITDAALKSVSTLTALQTLYVSNTGVSDAGLQYLQGLVKLGELGLNRTRITDEGLTHLRGLTNLHTLSLVGTKVTDRGLQQLNGLRNLKRIYVSETGVTPEGIREFKKSLPKVEIVK